MLELSPDYLEHS